MGLAAVEKRDLVPAFQGRFHEVATQKRGAAQDEKLQAFSQTEAMPWPTPMHIVATP